ncbi:HAD family hydrolase [Streptomyces acidiscabies]|uniref:Haloacid dehalogenase-like hydrolase n=1 Tax=Streptomyces acidiscabies TaxID=42234 RepID=A0AAP6BH79_9ACTN|nr:haloacid dehalogenase-like hydrolase [Streptomyces acidiscabies]MBP5935347.1 HAD hydrolase-like protein [Streptomyces sp. LBUM 1476]MBZ3916816.1 haloacid dehalogenase-like hydrolase [Streptomyces acidiscabies]MDX2964417.1 haloacid dehalogenase-like hydrolase [Streptomyces acidiscabies]MDX3022966.1 haloacid dehalogenase-like hydrolase [Streptomyces acidiscabies]MDX3794240.1 haloacid dehalogenase-like hydrolase [Streptomyces acidiscabies]
MTDAAQVLVLWDIDRTLLYVGDIDRQVYRETFAEIVGRPAQRLPARGTGVTMPLAIRSLLLDNDVPEPEVPALVPRMVALLPQRLAVHADDLRERGVLLPGVVDALKAVRAQPNLLPTVLTGNLKPNALLKLEAFGLDEFLDTQIGGYSSDNDHRPALVAVAQERAQAKHGTTIFTRTNTVIIGDSLEDVRTGLEGGAAVIAVTSGKATADELAAAGADLVLDSLEDVPRLLEAIATATRNRT